MVKYSLIKQDANQYSLIKRGTIVYKNKKDPSGFIERIFEELEKGDFVFIIDKQTGKDILVQSITIGQYKRDIRENNENRAIADIAKSIISKIDELKEISKEHKPEH